MQKPIHKRKNKHLDVCLNLSADIEPQTSRFSEIHLVPQAFPECSLDDIDTTCEFAGKTISMPLIISPMTGGTHQGRQLNEVLFSVAERCKLPIGLGSMRAMLEDAADARHYVPDTLGKKAVVIANIGAVELLRHSFKRIFDCCERLGAGVLSIHINAAQELMQDRGDTNFSGLMQALAQLHAQAPIPILVKETGFGIDPQGVRTLCEIGIEYIDISGSGGSNWAVIEALAQNKALSDESVSFYTKWGISTALLLRVLRHVQQQALHPDEAFFSKSSNKIIASGGVRSLYDMVMCLASGASYVGMALPMMRRAAGDGEEKLLTYIKQLQSGLQNAMLTAGASSIQSLQSCRTWCDAAMQQEVEQIAGLYSAQKSRSGRI